MEATIASNKKSPIKTPPTGMDKYSHPMETPSVGDEASETIGKMNIPCRIMTQQNPIINKRKKLDNMKRGIRGSRSRMAADATHSAL